MPKDKFKMNKKIILHIGMGKCASSAIQEYLTFNSHLSDRKGNKYIYGSLTLDGNILFGDAIKDIALKNQFNYSSSPTLSNIEDTNIFSELFFNELKNIDSHLILSCEGWVHELDTFKQIFQSGVSGFDVEVVFYVRPPISWLNSAWWQWGAWTGAGLDLWVKNNIASTFWVDYIEQWNDAAFVNTVKVRVLNDDIVSDFLSIYSIDNIAGIHLKSNVSLPGIVLRYFQKYRELRPTVHDSRIDFAISRNLDLNESADWVIDEKMAKNILNKTIEKNKQLLKFFDHNSKNSVLQDDKWWSIDWLQTKTIKPAGILDVQAEDSDELVFKLLKSMNNLDCQVRELQAANKIKKTITLENFIEQNYNSQADILRDFAIFFEKHDYRISKFLMTAALSLRPSGPLIKRKLQEYKKKLKKNWLEK